MNKEIKELRQKFVNDAGLNSIEKRELEKILTKLNRQFLHAKTLGFIHPKRNKQMIFNSILPKELEIILKTLRNIGK